MQVSAAPPNAAKEGNLRRRSASAAARPHACRRVWRSAHAAKNSRLGLATPIRTLASWPRRSKPANGIRKVASFTASARCADTEAQGGGGSGEAALEKAETVDSVLARNGATGRGISDQDLLDAYAQGTTAEGRTELDPTLLARRGDLGLTLSNGGKVLVDPEALSTEGLAKSVLDHEGAHVGQIGEGRFYGVRGSPEQAVNEIEAYRAGLAESVHYSGDALLDQYRGAWMEKLSDLIYGLQGTPYFNNVTSWPPNYALNPGTACPATACWLNPVRP